MSDAEHIELARIARRQWREGGCLDPLPAFCVRGIRLVGEGRDIIHGPARLLQDISGEEHFFEDLPEGRAAVRIDDDGRGDAGLRAPLYLIISTPKP